MSSLFRVPGLTPATSVFFSFLFTSVAESTPCVVFFLLHTGSPHNTLHVCNWSIVNWMNDCYLFVQLGAEGPPATYLFFTTGPGSTFIFFFNNTQACPAILYILLITCTRVHKKKHLVTCV